MHILDSVYVPLKVHVMYLGTEVLKKKKKKKAYKRVAHVAHTTRVKEILHIHDTLQIKIKKMSSLLLYVGTPHTFQKFVCVHS